jgi:glycosyltransferase involved in cell wall biosynthesis
MIFLGHKSVANKFIGSLKGRQKMIYLMKKAKHVITCTPHLDQFVRNYNQNTTDISSTINTETYIPINKYNNDKKLIIGWSGSHSTSKYMKLLENVLKKLKERFDFEIMIMGDPHFFIEGLNCKTIRWEERTEIQTLQQFDIGVYPLPLDDDWVLGKSGLKALQYMALGIPTVATAVGANFRVIEDAKSGFLVLSENDWIEKLSLLIENPVLRRQIGEEGRKRVEKYYSIISNRDTYLEILNKVSGED